MGVSSDEVRTKLKEPYFAKLANCTYLFIIFTLKSFKIKILALYNLSVCRYFIHLSTILKVSLILCQFLILYSNYTIFGERIVSQVCHGEQISSRTGTVTQTEHTEHFSGDAQV